MCFPWLRPYATTKLDPRSTKCIFLVYSPSKSSYKCYDPCSHKLYHSRHVEFVEHTFPFDTPSTVAVTLPISDEFIGSAPATTYTPTTTRLLQTTLPIPTPFSISTTPINSLENSAPSSPQSPEASTSSPTPDSPLSSPPFTPIAQFTPSPPQTPPPAPYHLIEIANATSNITTLTSLTPLHFTQFPIHLNLPPTPKLRNIHNGAKLWRQSSMPLSITKHGS